MPVGLQLAQALLDAFVAVCMLLAGILPAAGMLLLERRTDNAPDIVRHLGAVVVDARAFDAVSQPVGRYGDQAIYDEVVFKSLRYRYAGIAPPGRCLRTSPSEVVLVPGIVYRAIDCAGPRPRDTKPSAGTVPVRTHNPPSAGAR